MQKSYDKYDTVDFIQDDYFVNWVSSPDFETNLFWENWQADHPGKANEIAAARHFLEKVSYEQKYVIDPSRMNAILENSLKHKQNLEVEKQNRIDLRRKVVWYAAAVVLLVLASYFAVDTISNDSSMEVPTVSMVRQHAAYGVKKTFTLPDGSRVKLNSGSQLMFPENFNGNQRRVALEGEAFFEVAKNTEKPFFIELNDMVVQVVGTSFNIRAVDGEDKFEVAVVSGLVRVMSDSDSLLIHPNNMAVFNREQKQLSVSGFDSAKQLAWKDGVLHFKKARLSTVFAELEKWYGVQLIVADQVNTEEKYSGEYYNETLENVLKGISYTSHFDFKIDGKQVTILKPKK
ncbi:MAG: FecR domain-containing protein [Cyclobacteriaceae bacterium]